MRRCPACGSDELLVSVLALFQPRPDDPHQGILYGSSMVLLDEHHAVCNRLGCNWQGRYGDAARS